MANISLYITDADVVGQSAHVNVGRVQLGELRAQRGLRQFFVVPKHRIRVHVRYRPFVYFHRVVHDLRHICVIY